MNEEGGFGKGREGKSAAFGSFDENDRMARAGCLGLWTV